MSIGPRGGAARGGFARVIYPSLKATKVGPRRGKSRRHNGGLTMATIAKTYLALALAMGAGPLAAQEAPQDGSVRIATFNASLNRGEEGQLAVDLSDPSAIQPARVAEIIQRVNPDVILINEFDYDEVGESVSLFIENFLSQSQNGAEPWVPAAGFSAPVNTGVPTGLDLNGDGETDGPDDAFGFGMFPGQYGMVVLSK